uniref:Uncharacterized protein n=1 Tax=Anguilla anguilla TaxID=7936 RepID=A0A0E9SVH7_ANGAN
MKRNWKVARCQEPSNRPYPVLISYTHVLHALMVILPVTKEVHLPLKFNHDEVDPIGKQTLFTRQHTKDVHTTVHTKVNTG